MWCGLFLDPQSSVLSPALFNLYMSSLGHVVRHLNKMETIIFNPNFLLPSSDSFSHCIDVCSVAPARKPRHHPGPCPLLQGTRHPRHQNIFLLPPQNCTPPPQPSLLSCWNTYLRLHHFQTRLLQQHPLQPSFHRPPKKYVQHSAAWLLTHSHSREYISLIIHQHFWLSIGQDSLHHPAKLCTILHPHTWLISLITTHPPPLWRGQPSHLHH